MNRLLNSFLSLFTNNPVLSVNFDEGMESRRRQLLNRVFQQYRSPGPLNETEIDEVIKLLFLFLILVGGLYIAFRNFDGAALADLLVHIQFPEALLAAFFAIAAGWVRALRWRLILAPIRTPSIWHLFSATMIGYFGNGVLPFRAGELVKAYMVHNYPPKPPFAAVLGTIVANRILDLCGLVILSASVLFIFDVPTWVAYAAKVLGFVTITGATVLWFADKYGMKLIDFTMRTVLPKIQFMNLVKKQASVFVEGMSTLRRSGAPGRIAGYTIAFWVAQWGIMHYSALALGIDVSWIDSCVILVVTMMATSIPSTPANVGPFHAASVIVMTVVLGYSDAVGQAYAILSHTIRIVLPIVLGGLLVVTTRVQWRNSSEALEQRR